MVESMEKVKVLYFVDRMLRGGIQTFVLENLRHMDGSRVQIDFLLLDDGKTYELEDELRTLGSNVYKLDKIWLNNGFDYIKYWKSINDFFDKYPMYQVVHLHSASKNFIILKAAKKHGINVRIAHSHNIEFQTKSRLKILVGDILKIPLRYYATDYFACSYLAGKWLFGDKIADNNLVVVKNAVDINKFQFNEQISVSMKERLGLTDSFVVGHVGRFTHQKNHQFLIEIFNEIIKIRPNSKLLLVGTGELEDEIRSKVADYNLTNNVQFIGFQQNVNDYMQAMDVFVFPSEYEGLGLVLIEAQASGLLCFTSKDVVPEEAKVSDLITFISLKKDASEWAEVILRQKILKRQSPKSDIIRCGYDICETALLLQNFYIERAKDSIGDYREVP